MRRVMTQDKEKLITNLNLNKEIRKTCEANNKLKEALDESVQVPIQIEGTVFAELF